VCKQCGSHSLERVLSRVPCATLRRNPPGTPGRSRCLSGVDENDPKSVAKVLKKMGQEMGEDFPGEVDQMVEEAMDSQDGDRRRGVGPVTTARLSAGRSLEINLFLGSRLLSIN